MSTATVWLVQDTIGVLPPASPCKGPPAFTGIGRYTYFFTDSITGQIIGQNCHVRFKVVVIDNGGGHCHTDAGHPLGTPSDTTGFTGSDGLAFNISHRWPEVGGVLGGIFYSTDSLSTSNIPCPDYNDSTTIHYLFCLANQSFFAPRHAIYTQGPGDTLVGTTPEHPDNNIGIPGMLNALSSLSNAWAAKYPSGPKLRYNDMTIFGGGVFDELNHNWKPPHCGHRAGMEMDFGIKNLNETHRRTADEMLKARKFKVLPESVRVHVKIAGRDTTIKVPDHWYLKYAGPDTYKGPGSTVR